MNKIILASNSPRRKELLQREGIDFIIDASSIEETLDDTLPIEKRLELLAYSKGKPIADKYQQDIVISADTIVYHNNMIIGKAKDEDEARSILSHLSNDCHIVYTAVAIFDKGECMTFIDATEVYFKDITNLIDDYIKSNDWVGKAGAYGIQSGGSIFVDYIIGDIDTVIGLPVKRVAKILNKKIK